MLSSSGWVVYFGVFFPALVGLGVGSLDLLA